MTEDQHCERQSEVLRAARSLLWDDSTRRHLDSCTRCREAVKVALALKSLAESPDEVTVMPDPRLLWLKASFAQRQEQSQRVSRIAAVAYGILTTFLGLGGYWFTRTNPIHIGAQVQSLLPSGEVSAPLLILVFLVMALVFAFAPSRRHSAS